MRFVALGVAVVAAGVLSVAHPRAAQVCEYHVSPVWNDIAAAGQTGTITIDTQPDCAWTATVTDTWVAVDTLSGTGPGAINYTAAPIAQLGLRQARIKVRWNAPTLGQDVILTQQNGPCAATFTPDNTPVSSLTFGALPGAGAFDVVPSDPTTGAWTMTTNADWIALAPSSGVVAYGVGQARFTVAANPSPQARAATVVGCDGSMFTIRQAGRTAATGHYVSGDFDGDGKADLAIYRRTTHVWYVLLSSFNYDPSGAIAIDATIANSFWPQPLTGDLDGDGRSEAIVFDPFLGATFRPFNGTWVVRYSTDAYRPGTITSVRTAASAAWGLLPIVADFDGSGKGALTTYDPGTGMWRSMPSAGSSRSLPDTQWGRPSDAPVPGDYDGDGITDLAVWRPADGRWYILYSSTGYDPSHARAYQWGTVGDIPFAGDFDGDGLSDLAVYRPSNGTWYINFSSRGYNPADALSVQWGAATTSSYPPSDIPVPADYDGDGRLDLAVWRPSNGTWYILFSSSNYAYAFAHVIQWGSPSYSDIPVGAQAVPKVLTAHSFAPPPLHPGDYTTAFVSFDRANYPESTQPLATVDERIFGRGIIQFEKCAAACDDEFDIDIVIPSAMAPGVYTLPVSVTDEQGRRADTAITISVVSR